MVTDATWRPKLASWFGHNHQVWLWPPRLQPMSNNFYISSYLFWKRNFVRPSLTSWTILDEQKVAINWGFCGMHDLEHSMRNKQLIWCPNISRTTFIPSFTFLFYTTLTFSKPLCISIEIRCEQNFWIFDSDLNSRDRYQWKWKLFANQFVIYIYNT